MPHSFDFTGAPMNAVEKIGDGMIVVHNDQRVLDGFNSTLTVRLGDLPPSVLKEMWDTLDWEHAGFDKFLEVIAQVFFDQIGEDISDPWPVRESGRQA